VDALNNKREEVEGICGFGIFIDKNAIEISILEGADPGKIIENLNILLKPVLPSYLHSLEQMITLKPGGQYITYTATTNGTTMVRLQKDGSSVQGFASAAVKYYSSTYGSGFITTTHGLSDFNIGTKVYKIHCD
jgi:hypothetical protein